jgi:translation initiation factor 3 subunit F
LVVSYLANTIRTQMELSNRLATAQLTLGGGEAGSGAAGEQGNRQRGGKGRGGGHQRQDRGQVEEARA